MSYYELLGVASDAGTREIRRAYWRRALRAHPDQGGSAEEFHALHAAYLALIDPRTRAEHDAKLAELKRPRPQPPRDDGYAYVDIAVARARRGYR